MSADIEDFIQEITELSQHLLSASEIEITYKLIDKASLRIIINADTFIDVYANIENGRYDFSLIKDSKRIFGYDNLGNWHCHPLQGPDMHVVCAEPSVEKVFKEIADIINS